MIRQKLAYFV